jgi:hypothetical protein
MAGFRAQVLDDGRLQDELLAIDPGVFAQEASAIAAREGWTVSPAELDDALRAARREWLERWV